MMRITTTTIITTTTTITEVPHKAPKKIKNMNPIYIKGRVQKMLELRDYWLEHLDEAHIILQKGNSKTGQNCYTVSLIPIADCPNCSGCWNKCYDILNVCFQPDVQNDRARNSAIHKADIKRFWAEIELQIRALFVTELRINVGGDLTEEDFYYVKELGKRNPKCDILFFTKNYDGINSFLDKNEFPTNVKALMSAWPEMEMQNPHNLPCSHVLFVDGTTTAPDFGAVFCNGNCSECHFNETGCWTLKKGEHVIFPAH